MASPLDQIQRPSHKDPEQNPITLYTNPEHSKGSPKQPETNRDAMLRASGVEQLGMHGGPAAPTRPRVPAQLAGRWGQSSARRASHGERSRTYLHFKLGGTENLSILAVNALAVNVLAVNSVS